jgi:hypothetical protein
MLFKSINGEHIDSIFTIISEIRHDNLYVKLGVAWLIGGCCIHFPEKTIEFLASQMLNPHVQNIAIRKIMESFRIPTSVNIQAKRCQYQ